MAWTGKWQAAVTAMFISAFLRSSSLLVLFAFGAKGRGPEQSIAFVFIWCFSVFWWLAVLDNFGLIFE